MRYGLFVMALTAGYSIDTDSMHGLLGAVVGIFIIRFVTIYLGVTGADMNEEQS